MVRRSREDKGKNKALEATLKRQDTEDKTLFISDKSKAH